MMLGLTGVPGTGKTTVGDILHDRGIRVVRINDTIGPYIIGEDLERETLIIDEEPWADAFVRIDGVVEGHLAHLLPCDRIVILRCDPDLLYTRLIQRGYSERKAGENAMAEALDTILIESLELFDEDMIYEYETTNQDIRTVADFVEDVMMGRATPSHGTCNWSEYLMTHIP